MDSKAFRTTLIRRLPLIWISLAFIWGVVAGTFWAVPVVWAWLGLAIFLLLWKLLPRRLERLLALGELVSLTIALLSLAAFSFGLIRTRSILAAPDISDVAFYNNVAERIELVGQIKQPPISKSTYLELIVATEKIRLEGETEWIPVDGGIRVLTDFEREWTYGEGVFLVGSLEAPSLDQLSYRAYQQRRGFQSEMFFPSISRTSPGTVNPFFAVLFSFRQSALQLIDQLYPEPASALLSGILLGDESRLSDSLKDDFNRTGTRHVIAISGFNIAIIAALFLSLFRRLVGPLRGRWIALAGIAVYTVLVGADAAVTRAAVMAAIALLARQAGRVQDGVVTLILSAALMAIFNPLIIWDIGFQLSFAATFGIILFAERLSSWALAQLRRWLNEEQGQAILPWLTENVLLTLAAQLTTFPILLYYFHRFSLSSIPSNLVILPLQPLIMILGGLSVFLGFAFYPLGQILAWLVWPLLAATIRIVEFFASFNWGSSTVGQISIISVAIAYGFIAWLARKSGGSPIKTSRWTPASVAALFSMGTLLLWLFALAQPDGHTRMTIFGDERNAQVLVQTSEGRNLLLSLGSPNSELVTQVQRELPFFRQSLDWLILSGDRYDYQFSSIVERLSGPRLAFFAESYSNFEVSSYYESARSLAISITQLQVNSHFRLSPQGELRPIRLSDSGSVFLITEGEFAALVVHAITENQIELLLGDLSLAGVDMLVLIGANYSGEAGAAGFQHIPSAIITNAPPSQLSESASQPSNLFSLLETGWLRISTDGSQLSLERHFAPP